MKRRFVCLFPQAKLSRNYTANPDFGKNIDRVVSKATRESGKWLRLSEITFKDQNNKLKRYELVERATRTENSVDVSIIVPILKEKDRTSIVLVKQYRPALDALCVELPAGLIDAGESPEECAIRELHEETGYQGKVLFCGDAVSLAPGISNEDAKIVFVEIDGEHESNKEPTQKLEETEEIEVVKIALAEKGQDKSAFLLKNLEQIRYGALA
eukprot:CAMPEP_0174270840 /NCGR_PEP_ID=MMETSP0439-20130205/45907_1 /TAXON_ID=0 /ORGANISM="Stereomyxa ramosa, Strain Chinc5" /LENGTH=212 /DNA_ID=CAMNT_0015360429 /DNA_START=1 /DNA_END=636 /DNA_ORIENTATION=+